MTGASAFKKTQKATARPHRERSQPAFRKKLGLLEKKKDYKQRADNYKQKSAKLTQLKQKAEFKNPDEFYFGMVNSKLVDGEHVTKNEGLSKEEIALIETKDVKWLHKRILMENRKIERLRKSVQIFESDVQLNQHLLFLDDDEAGIDLADKFNTEPELLNRTHNRLRKSQLEDMTETSTASEKNVNYERGRTTRELEQRLQRLDKLKKALKTLDKSRADDEDQKSTLEVENKKLAQKYNFVHLRKK